MFRKTLFLLGLLLPAMAVLGFASPVAAASKSPVGFTIGDYAGDFVKEKETGRTWYIDVAASRRHEVTADDEYLFERLLGLAQKESWPRISALPEATSATSTAKDLKRAKWTALRGLVYDENAPDLLWHVRRRAGLRQALRSREDVLAYVANAMVVKSADLYEYPIAEAAYDYTVKDPAKAPATSTAMTRPDAKKFIRVSLKEQRLRAYENGKLVNTFLVSTGRGKFPTPKGDFSVLAKLPWVYYKWVYSVDSPDNYDLGSVPFNLRVMPHKYIHYAYWHNNFGRTMSHGCINVNLKNVKWIYRWADEGVPVLIH